MNGPYHRKRTGNLNTEDERELQTTTEVDLADLPRIQCVLRAPPWLSLVLRVGILSCGLSDRSGGGTFTGLPCPVA